MRRHPAIWTKESYDWGADPSRDQLAPARGFLWGLAFGSMFWIIVGLVLALLF